MIADRIVNEADKTEDGSICFEEFQEALADLDFEGKMAFVSFSWNPYYISLCNGLKFYLKKHLSARK